MNKPQLISHEFTEQHYVALGKMLVAFQSLEATVTCGLLKLLQPGTLVPDSALAAAVVGELSFANRLKLLLIYPSLPGPKLAPSEDKLAEVRQQVYAEAVDLLKQGGRIAAEAEEKRNQLVHSWWLSGCSIAGSPDGTVFRVKSRIKKNKVHVSNQFITAKDIEAVVEEMNTAESQLQKAVQHLNYLTVSALPSE